MIILSVDGIQSSLPCHSLCGLAKLKLQENVRLASSNVHCQGKIKLKRVEIPKNEEKDNAMDTVRHKGASIFAVSHLFAEVCRGYIRRLKSRDQGAVTTDQDFVLHQSEFFSLNQFEVLRAAACM